MKAGIIAVIVVAVLGIGGFALTHKSKPTTNTSNSDMSSMSNMSNSSSDNSNSNNAVATNSVEISNFAFSPVNITVKKGTKVTWTNKDTTGHTVTSDDGDNGGLDSKLLAQGESYSATFNTAGTFKYHCSIHSEMTGTVTVTE